MPNCEMLQFGFIFFSVSYLLFSTCLCVFVVCLRVLLPATVFFSYSGAHSGAPLTPAPLWPSAPQRSSPSSRSSSRRSFRKPCSDWRFSLGRRSNDSRTNQKYPRIGLSPIGYTKTHRPGSRIMFWMYLMLNGRRNARSTMHQCMAWSETWERNLIPPSHCASWERKTQENFKNYFSKAACEKGRAAEGGDFKF